MPAPALHTEADWELLVRLTARSAEGTRSPLSLAGRSISAVFGLPDDTFIAEVPATAFDVPTATVRAFVPVSARSRFALGRQAFLHVDFFDVTGGGRRYLARATPSLISGPRRG